MGKIIKALTKSRVTKVVEKINIELQFAVKNKDKKVILSLLKQGANPNSALSFSPDVETATLLLAHGANINTSAEPEQGATLLHMAVYAWNLKLIKFVLENGADVNLKDKDGLTALQLFFNDLSEVAIDIEPRIYTLFSPYIINCNNKEEFLFLLNGRPYLDSVDINKIKTAAYQNCILWINEQLTSENKPFWLHERYEKELRDFSNRLINKLYPGLLNAINDIINEKNFSLIKIALLSPSLRFGLSEGLNSVIQLYESGLLDNLIAEKIQCLHEKMELLFARYIKFNIPEPISTEKEKQRINALVEPLHYALFAFGDYSKIAYSWQRNRMLKKFSEIENFPIKDKIKKIAHADDWLKISTSSLKNSKNQTKNIFVLHEFQKDESDEMKQYAKLRLN